MELKVEGIFQTTSALNDEVLVPIYIGQWLRGLTYNDATVIRAKIDLTQTNPKQIYQEIATQTTPSTTTTSPSPTPKSQTQQQLEALILSSSNKPQEAT